MGLVEKIFGRESEGMDVGNLDELVADVDSMPAEAADFYVTRMEVRNEGDADLVLKALSERKIMLIGLQQISKQPNRCKSIVGRLKTNTLKMGGDIALLSNDLLLATPASIRIMKSKPKIPK